MHHLICHSKHFLQVFCSLVFLLITSSVFAQTRINHLISHIHVQPDASFRITDTLMLSSSTQSTAAPLVRNFPIYQSTQNNLHQRLHYKILSVQQQQIPIQYQTKLINSDQTLQLTIPPQNMLHAPQTEMTITYQVSRVLVTNTQKQSFYYFPVSANSYSYPTDSVLLRISMPPSLAASSPLISVKHLSIDHASPIPVLQNEDFWAAIFASPLTSKTNLQLEMHYPLQTFPSPSFTAHLHNLQQDFPLALSTITAITIALIYLLSVYLLLRHKNQSAPLHNHPATPSINLSPASVSYLLTHQFTPHSFALQIMSLASKGCLTLDFRNKQFKLFAHAKKEANSAYQPLTQEESQLYDQLFANTSELSLNQKNLKIIKKSYKKQKKIIFQQHRFKHFYNPLTHLSVAAFWLIVSLINAYIFLPSPLTRTDQTSAMVLLAAFAFVTLSYFPPLLRIPTAAGQILLFQIYQFSNSLLVNNSNSSSRHIFSNYLPFVLATRRSVRFTRTCFPFVASSLTATSALSSSSPSLSPTIIVSPTWLHVSTFPKTSPQFFARHLHRQLTLALNAIIN